MSKESIENQKKELIEKALKIYGKIYPCLNKPSLNECFTVTKDKGLIFWFNTEDNSTHMVANMDVAVYDIYKTGVAKKKKRS